MVVKSKIVETLEGAALLLPERVTRALRANDRIKFALAWLQNAEATAHGAAGDSLAVERGLAGLDGDPLYAPAAAQPVPDGIAVAGASEVISRLVADLGVMLDCVSAGGREAAAKDFAARLARLGGEAAIADDVLVPGHVTRLARPPRDGIDSLHALTMDLHKAVNAVAAGLAEEDVDGARAFRLGPGDRELVGAFMRGLKRTAPLKFDHPGLATTATRDESGLLIQNDIGTTDAHVVMARIGANGVGVVYSDIHRRRLDFLCRRLPMFEWRVSARRADGFEEDAFHVATGVAADPARAADALEALGAALVFLIDWNKARKRLRALMSKADAIATLDWAADNGIGHRGFLEAGADGLVAELLDLVSKATGGFHPSLASAVGPEGAVPFVREAMRAASETLRAGRPSRAVRDLLRAELMARMASAGDRLAEMACDHAGLIVDLGRLIEAARATGADPAGVARRAKALESAADALVVAVRERAAGRRGEGAWAAILARADDAADGFEEAAFRLRFVPARLTDAADAALAELCARACDGARDYVRLLCQLRHVHRGAPAQDIADFMGILERLRAMEHATDDAERALVEAAMDAGVDAKTGAVLMAAGAAVEAAGDALLRAGLAAGDHAMGDGFDA